MERRVFDHSERPARANVEHPFVQATIGALRDMYGPDPVAYPNSAGSGSMHPFMEVLGTPVAGMRIRYPGSRLHHPNENTREHDFHLGIAAHVRLFGRYA